MYPPNDSTVPFVSDAHTVGDCCSVLYSVMLALATDYQYMVQTGMIPLCRIRAQLELWNLLVHVVSAVVAMLVDKRDNSPLGSSI